MTRIIWYVSKYLDVPDSDGKPGGRGFMILKELARKGHVTSIITSNSNHLVSTNREMGSTFAQETRDGVLITWVKTLGISQANTWRRVLSWLDFEMKLLFLPTRSLPNPDVIIVSSLSLLTILNGILLRKRLGCKLVFEVRDIWPLTLTEEGGYPDRNPFVMFLGLVEKLGYRSADVIVGTMPNLGAHVSTVMGRPYQVECIPMGVDPQVAREHEMPFHSTGIDQLPEGKFIVAYAGTIGATNALQTLLDCANSLALNSMIHFLVLGEGDLKSDFHSRYGHLPNLTFLAKVPKQDVHATLAMTDLLYLGAQKSRIWDYGQSFNKLIDYMMAAKPIVSSYSGFPTMINEAGCGSFVPAEDSAALRIEIERYFGLPASDRTAIGQRGRNWILANRDYKLLADRYLNIMFPGTETKVP
jgi:glycosyltransferase involved in cell wall biosynthesis